MDVLLNKSPEEARKEFFALKTPKDIAKLLEVNYKTLNYHLYYHHGTNYTTFSIPKKNGGERLICAPITPIKILQSKLNKVLSFVYETKPSVHGFAMKRNIVTNAQRHVSKKYVFNIDLLNFFPTINFGRVRGLFIAQPYNLPQKVSTVLAQICCFDGKLPQGAPTSPIVSNMICSRMDGQLQRLAKKMRCTYTRYADDITFSTTRKTFPEALGRIDKSSGNQIVSGTALFEIIDSNGFSINTSKIRLYPKYSRQQVTGLTTNQFPNVRRKYINQIRAMLHAWDKYEARNAGIHHLKQYYDKHKGPSSPICIGTIDPEALFKSVVRGKVNFLKMVKGPRDKVFQKFGAKLSELDSHFAQIFSKIRVPGFEDLIYVVENNFNQGTGFLLKGIGLVTCKHTMVGNGFYVNKGSCPDIRINVEGTLWEDENIDLAILKTKIPISKGFEIGDSRSVKRGDQITVLGFPKYSPGQGYQQHNGQVTGEKQIFGLEHKLVGGASIMHGNSGGPVLNKAGEVIGVASRGSRDLDEAKDVEHCFIPIHVLLEKLPSR